MLESIKRYYSLYFILFLFFYILSIFLHRKIESYFINNYNKEITGVIIDNKNYFGNSPVSHEYSYSYSFYTNGSIYMGNSHDSSLQIGDSITIEYCHIFPNFNRVKIKNKTE
jgi:hypothetical protein